MLFLLFRPLVARKALTHNQDVYLKMLDEQLKQGISVLDQQVKYQRDCLA